MKIKGKLITEPKAKMGLNIGFCKIGIKRIVEIELQCR